MVHDGLLPFDGGRDDRDGVRGLLRACASAVPACCGVAIALGNSVSRKALSSSLFSGGQRATSEIVASTNGETFSEEFAFAQLSSATSNCCFTDPINAFFVAFSHGHYLSLPFLGLFLFGYLYVGAFSVYQRR